MTESYEERPTRALEGDEVKPGEKAGMTLFPFQAAAHRAQASLRAADGVADASARKASLETTASLFEAALAMDEVAYGFYDFLYDYCRVLRRLERAPAALGAFRAAREAHELRDPLEAAPQKGALM